MLRSFGSFGWSTAASHDTAAAGLVEGGLQSPRQRRDGVQPLTVVTQNLYASETADPTRRVRAFADYLERARPDIVAVQELMPWNAKLLLSSEAVRRLYPLAEADLLGGGETTPWTYVLSRWPRLERRRVSGIGDWRGLDVQRLNVSGAALTVASAHFTADDCPVAPSVDEQEAAGPGADRADWGAACPGGAGRVADLQATLSALDGAEATRDALLLGDFNFGPTRHPAAAAVWYGAELEALRGHPQWRDAWAEGNASLGLSWDNQRNPINKRGDEHDVPFNQPSSRCDRVLVRGKHLRVRSARLLEGRVPCRPRDERSCTPTLVSDHFGVKVAMTLAIRPPKVDLDKGDL